MEFSDISMLANPAATVPLAGGPAAAAESAGAAELRQASQQFEAVLIRQYLNEALKPLLNDTMGSGVTGSDMYQYMITDKLADELANQNTFGVASLLQMQLTAPSFKDSQNNNP